MSLLLKKYQTHEFPPQNSKQLFWTSCAFSGILLFLFGAFFFKESGLQLIITLIYTIISQFFVLAIYWKYCDSVQPNTPEAIHWTPQPALKLELQEIILKEFDYARETASQAMSDRHSLVNFFLIITGVTVSAASAWVIRENTGLGESQRFLLETVCLIFNTIGWIYFIKIIRLRQAWHESATAMNQIKAFFIQHCNVQPEISVTAFRWQKHTLPKPGKKSTVFYYSALLIAFISSIALTIAWFSAIRSTHLKLNIWIPSLIGFYHFFFQRQLYSIFLDKPVEKI
jgi:hypothetical protein